MTKRAHDRMTSTTTTAAAAAATAGAASNAREKSMWKEIPPAKRVNKAATSPLEASALFFAVRETQT